MKSWGEGEGVGRGGWYVHSFVGLFKIDGDRRATRERSRFGEPACLGS